MKNRKAAFATLLALSPVLGLTPTIEFAGGTAYIHQALAGTQCLRDTQDLAAGEPAAVEISTHRIQIDRPEYPGGLDEALHRIAIEVANNIPELTLDLAGIPDPDIGARLPDNSGNQGHPPRLRLAWNGGGQAGGNPGGDSVNPGSQPGPAAPTDNLDTAQAFGTSSNTENLLSSDEGLSYEDFVTTDEPATAVPEPGTLALFIFGLAGLGFSIRRGKRQ